MSDPASIGGRPPACATEAVNATTATAVAMRAVCRWFMASFFSSARPRRAADLPNGTVPATAIFRVRFRHRLGTGLHRARRRGNGGAQSVWSAAFACIPRVLRRRAGGAGYAAASLGCALPIFLALVGASLGADKLAVFGAYGIGMTVVLVSLAVAAALVREGTARAVRPLLPYVGRASGVLLLATGGYLV